MTKKGIRARAEMGGATRAFLTAWRHDCATLEQPVPEHRVRGDRRWRFDLAWPQSRVALEIEGAVWSNGRHTRGSGFISDCEKYNAAASDGWLVIRAPSHLLDKDPCAYVKLVSDAIHTRQGASDEREV